MDEEIIIPASFSQERLWFLDQFEPGSAVYNMRLALRLLGPLDASAFVKALDEIVHRHEPLRTNFRQVGGRPVQVIHKSGVAEVNRLDLRRIPEHQRKEHLLRLAGEEARKSFDLSNDPLIRFTLLELSKEEHVFLLTAHHAVFDGWSMGIFLSELEKLYKAYSQGGEPALPPLNVQYKDFTRRERDWMRGEVQAVQLEYWKRQLCGELPILNLPVDRPRPRVQSFNGGKRSLLLPLALATELESVARRNGATLFMVLLAGFVAFLCRLTGQTDVVVGTPVANRTEPSFERLIGFFANTLALRTSIEGDLTFREHLLRVRDITLDAYDNQHLPFSKLVESLRLRRNLSHTPIFQTMLVLQNTPRETFRLPDVSVEYLDTETQTSMFDLTLFAERRIEGLRLMAEFNTDLFNAQSIDRLMTCFRRLLEGAAEYPEMRLSQLPLLGAREEELVLHSWNLTSHDYPHEKCIHELFEEQVGRTPGATAAVFEGDQITYRQLNGQANLIARRLRQLGVKPEAIVGICVDRSISMLAGVLGILKAGGAYLPLDPAFPADRLRYMSEDAKVRLLVIDGSSRVTFWGNDRCTIDLDTVLSSSEPSEAENVVSGVMPQNLAYVIYTSGSTGKPKGIQVEHRAVVNFLTSMGSQIGIRQKDRLLAVTTLSFDIAVLELLLPLTVGAQIHIVSHSVASDGYLLGAAIDEQRVTVMQATPSTWRLLLDAKWDPNGPFRALCGGEALPLDLARELERRCEVVWNLYGPTETTVWSTGARLERGANEIPIGRPIANTRAYVLDQNLQPLPIGVPGELFISGDGVSRGYLGHPRMTAARFVPDPFSGQLGARMYGTGDQARRLSDGNLYYMGRLDQQVKVRGFRVELGEIDACMTDHPNVKDALTVVEQLDERDKRLVAYFVAGSEPSLHSGTRQDDEGEDLERLVIDQWKAVWDSAFDGPPPYGDPAFNTSGWTDSYTGLPFSRDEMEEWVSESVRQVAGLSPSRILEIGCGTGLLLFRLAGQSETYIGTDFSDVALSHIRGQLDRLGPAASRVSLHALDADDLSSISHTRVDTVILNSVVQYFPSSSYLTRVIERAIDLTEDGGHLYVGDVRSLPLLGAFHTSVELRRAAASITREQLLARILNAQDSEHELVLDPAYFADVATRVPRIKCLEVIPKGSAKLNEMSRFRYDVIFHVGSGSDPRNRNGTVPEIVHLDWPQAGMNCASDLQSMMRGGAYPAIALNNIPNSRVQRWVEAFDGLCSGRGPGTVARILEQWDRENEKGVDPAEVRQLAEANGYAAHLSWGSGRSDGSFDALLERATDASHQSREWAAHVLAKGGGAGRLCGEGRQSDTTRASATTPLHTLFERMVAKELQMYLRQKLPGHMVPPEVVPVKRIPRTLNGKADREALEALARGRSNPLQSYVAPRNAVEQVLTLVWADVLKVNKIGVEDDFFDLGGHSLLATLAVARTEEVLRVAIPLRSFFESPTVAGQWKWMNEDSDRAFRANRAAELFLLVDRMPEGETESMLREKLSTGRDEQSS